MEGFKVLMYHEIIKKSDFDYPSYKGIKVQQAYQDILPPVLFSYMENFEKQMEYLKAAGYITISLEDVIGFYYDNKPLPEKAVLLTFDDMYKSVLKYAYPILRMYGFHSVGFVVEDWIFNEEQADSANQSVCLSKAELKQMAEVFEYANHTKALHTRSNGQGALQSTDKASFIADIKACEEFVSTRHAFAYPFGIYTKDNIAWLKGAGFLLGFTSEAGTNTKATDPFMLHRNGVLLDYDLEKFKAMLEE